MANFLNKITTFIVSKVDSITVFAEYYKRSSGKKAEWNRQSINMSAKEIKDWKNGLMQATDPENPRRGTLMRFYQNMMTDLHLGSCVDNRILPIQCAPFKLVDKSENEDKEAHKLLERPWYLDAVRLVCSNTFDGTKLMEMFDLNEKGELKEISEIPQSNFIPQKGIIVKEEWDEKGVPYKDGAYKDYYIQIGSDWNLGLFSQIAIIIIAKKLGLGSWMSYIERYGVPPIFAITDRLDTGRRDELFEMLTTFRMNHFAVLQGNEKIETPKGYNVDAYNTFKSLIDDVANKEMSKRIQGGTGTSDEKSYVGSAEVHERLLKYRHQVDKLIFKFYFNEEIKPRLVKLSSVYAPLENLTFEWDETETLSMKELLTFIQGLSSFYEFDIEELQKITGLPITGLRKSGFLNPEPEPDPQKKKPDTSGLIYKPLAKQAIGHGFVYAAAWNGTIERLSEQLFEGKIKPSDLDKDFVLKIYSELNKSAETAWGKDYYNEKITRKIRENLLLFSVAKANRIQEQISELKKLGLNKDAFIQEAKRVSNAQTGVYLDVEKNFAARSMQSAKDEQQFQKNKDIYPNCKYRTMEDDDVRHDHTLLNGMVKPVDDPVWITYTPPNGDRCRCWKESTTEQETVGIPDVKIPPRFANNTGMTGEVFTKEHSYFQMDKADFVKVRENAELMKEFLPYSHTEELSGGKKILINDFADRADLLQNIEAAKKLAEKLNVNIYIRPHFDPGKAPGRRNPELGIGKADALGDLKTYNEFVNGKEVMPENFINNSIQKLNKQRAEYGVLDFSNFEGNQADLEGALINRLFGSMNKINKNVKQIIVIQNNKVSKISRKQIENRDFTDFINKLK